MDSAMAILIDASYYIALSNINDVHHKRAALIAEKITRGQYGQPIITDDIFDEIISVMLRKFGKARAQIAARQVLQHLLVIHGTQKTFSQAVRLFEGTQDTFSFTDCTSHAVMTLANIHYIATFDKLFEKTDFTIVC